MVQRLGEDVEHDHATNDEGQAADGWAIERLTKQEPAVHRNEHDANRSPARVVDAGWNGPHCQGKKVKSDRIAQDACHRGPQLAHSVRGFEEAGRDDFGEDGNAKVEIRSVHAPQCNRAGL